MGERVDSFTYGLLYGTVGLCVALVVGLVFRASRPERRVVNAVMAAGIWAGVIGGAEVLARSGWLDAWDRFPPPAPRVFVPAMIASAVLGGSRVGRWLGSGVPAYGLVAAQAFRIPVEVVLARAYEAGALPVQMTFHGSNADIVTGVLAVVVGAGVAQGWLGSWAIVAFDVVGLLLLANIVGIALLSMPTPLRAFEGVPNTLVVEPGFILVPLVFVQTALLLHVISLRRALRGASGGRAPAAAA